MVICTFASRIITFSINMQNMLRHELDEGFRIIMFMKW